MIDMKLKILDIVIVLFLYAVTFAFFWFFPANQFFIPFAICNIIFVPGTFLGLRMTGMGLDRFSHVVLSAVAALVLCSVAALINESFGIVTFEGSNTFLVLAAIGYSIFLGNALNYIVERFEKRSTQ